MSANAEYRIVSVNRAFTEITGLEPTQLLNRDFTVLASDRRSMLTDISERDAAQARIEHVAHYDPLTDLPNRAFLADRLSHANRPGPAVEQSGGGAVQGLDHFKHVDDSRERFRIEFDLREVPVQMLLRLFYQPRSTATRRHQRLKRLGRCIGNLKLRRPSGGPDA